MQDNVPGVRKRIFLNSVFFVLGFSIVFSLLGVLLHSVLSGIAYDLRTYLGYVGGAVIIFFGLVLLGVIKIGVLQAEYKFSVKKTRFQYLSSALFGAAFAVGWTYLVLTEVIVMQSGLGYLIQISFRRGPKEHVYLVILLITLIAWAADLMWVQVGRALFRYRGSE